MPPKRVWWPWAVATAVAATMFAGWFFVRASRPTWNIVRVVAGDERPGRVTEGDWIETSANTTAQIEVGSIGVVDVEPNSRVRVVTARDNEHRLELGKGAIDATISAPPRLFFVGTPAVTAVDLGCAYRMESDESGNGVLHVRVGWVALEKGAREVFVPSGASCRIRAKRGAGTPYFDDATEAFRNALTDFDANGHGLDTLLAQAREQDTMTLWHLLPQVRGSDRERVFDRMAALIPLPKSVRREKAMALDPETLRQWREEWTWRW